jgi:hypothetical protein
MTSTERPGALLPDNALRALLWGGAGTLLLLPWIAMQFTAEVNWTAFDFLVFGAMLATACIACEIAVRVSRSNTYRFAAAIAVGTGFLLVWINLAVGIIGSENNLENLVYAGVLLVAVIGTAVARLRPASMARAMAITAIAHALTGVYGLAIGSIEAAVSAIVFVAAWLASAWAFHRAARVAGRE